MTWSIHLDGEVWSNGSSLTPPFLFIEMCVANAESVRVCICVLEVSNLILILETLRQKRWFQFSHCELSIYIYRHIPATPAYGIYIAQMIRYSRACGSYQDFLDRGLLLTRRLLNQGFLLVKLMSSLRIFSVATITWLTVMEYLCHKWPRICSTCRNPSRFFPHSWLITGLVTRLTRRVPLVEQELLTLPEHRSSPSGINGVSVTRSLVWCACFVDRCLSFCTISFCHCVVCSSLIYGFGLPDLYLHTLLKMHRYKCRITAFYYHYITVN
jgi:hypothetical protein